MSARLHALGLALRVRLEAPSPRVRRGLILAAVLAALLLATVPDVAFARGGGGGHAGGGGVHSGGGGLGGGGGGSHGGTGGGLPSGGGGGGFFPVGGGGFGGFGWFLPFLFWGGGGIAVFLILLFVLMAMTAGSRSGGSTQPGPYVEPEPYPLQRGRTELGADAGLAALQAADPAFDRTRFLDRVRQAFFTLQQAWEARDLTPARPFMGRGLYLGWLTQVRQLTALHKVNRMEDLAITNIAFAAANHGQRYDHVTVRVDATAADYEIDERDGRVIFGDKVDRPFTEYWTFERTAGTASPEKGLLDQVCPNCGAPAQINEVGECEYCRAAITNGRFDWVLARIDQADQWEAGAGAAFYSGSGASGAGVDPAAAAGVVAISGADPGFDADAFLERFEMAYFLVQQALQEGDLEPVQPYLASDLAKRWRQALSELGSQGHHLLLENLNLQGVELETAQQVAGSDVIGVRVVSVATRQVVRADGERVSGDSSDQRLTERWTLSRPTGTKTSEGGGVLAHRCPNCGEALAVDELGRCRSCQAAITQDGLDWSVSAVDPESWWNQPVFGVVRRLPA